MARAPDEAQLQAALRRIETLAHWFDDRYQVPGTRFRVGLDGILGLIPGVGDVLTNAVTAYIIYEAWRLGIPRSTLARMLANLGVDTVVGAVPLVGHRSAASRAPRAAERPGRGTRLVDS